jgi:hypothetical protein
LKKEYITDAADIMYKINLLEYENAKLKLELRKDKFPSGGLVYVIDFSENGIDIYRIGMTDNMKKRKKIYDTHSAFKKNVVLTYESDCPAQFEACVRSLLYKWKYSNKDFYMCDIEMIKKAFVTCQDGISCMKKQSGGGRSDTIVKEKRKLKSQLNKIMKDIDTMDFVIDRIK